MADGANLILGRSNWSSQVTQLSNSGTLHGNGGLLVSSPQLAIEGYSFGSGNLDFPAIEATGIGEKSHGLNAYATKRGTAVQAVSRSGVAVSVASTDGRAIEASALGGPPAIDVHAMGVGVSAYSASDYGVSGSGRIGVRGTGPDAGVYGFSHTGAGVVGQSGNPKDYAGFFWGRIAATGAKHAAVPQRDGSHRLFYSMESPECWFEDFGRARLRGGRVRVKLERHFSAVIRAREFHVFLSAEGDCNELYVSRRGSKEFEVRELAKGRSNASFSYRVVARRGDIEAPRMPRVKLPPREKAPQEPKFDPRALRRELERELADRAGRKPPKPKPRARRRA